MAEISWPKIQVHSASSAGIPVALGVPFPQGQVRDATTLAVRDPRGHPCLAGCRKFVTWPDGSTRWALVSFIAKAAGMHTVSSGDAATKSQAGVKIVRDQPRTGQMTLSNGVVNIVLSPDGPGPIAKLDALGKTFIVKPGDFRLCVDDANTTHELKRTLTVLEENAARVRVRVEGAHFGPGAKRKLSYRLDVELWPNQPVARIEYQFFNLEPGQEYLPIDRIAVEADLTFAGNTQRHFVQELHGIFQQPREVLNPAPVAIIVDGERRASRVEDYAMTLDTLDYPAYLDPPPVTASEWLGVTDGQTHAYMHMQDFINMPPKRLASEGKQLSLDVWPKYAGKLSLQQGRSRRQVITLAFATGERPSAASVRNMVTAPFFEGRATVAPEWFAHCHEFEQDRVLPYGKHGRFEKFFSRVVQLETPADMFDLGDTRDNGYDRSYPSQGLTRQPPIPGAPMLPRSFSAINGVLTSWVPLEHYERVWVNNEYDGIHAVACELMRTGQPGRWPLLRWMARHAAEVDFLHYHDQKWLSRSSPAHSHDHTTSGAYPSHFWTQGLMEYYCLTGDPDLLEVSVALADTIILHFHDPDRKKFYQNFDRENGWALLALVHVYDITREKRFGDEIERLVNFFMHGKQEGTATTPTPTGAEMKLNADMVSRFYFMLNLVEAMDLYQRITKRKDIADWLIKFLDPMPGLVFENFRNGMAALAACPALAIGYYRTGNPEFLRAGILRIEELLTDDPWWLNPVPQIKPMAIVYREFVTFMGEAQKAGMLGQFDYPSLRKE